MEWIQQNSDFLMVIITGVYVLATIAICVFNGVSAHASGKQIKDMKQQQEQNAGISLYRIRKDALNLFSHKNYDAMYWDSVLLFSDVVANGVLQTGHLFEQVKKEKWLIEEYESRMKNDQPELYDEYILLTTQINDHPDDEGLMNRILVLCDQYRPIYEGPLCDEAIILNYKDLTEKYDQVRHKYEAEHLKVFLQMKDEIKASISVMP